MLACHYINNKKYKLNCTHLYTHVHCNRSYCELLESLLSIHHQCLVLILNRIRDRNSSGKLSLSKNMRERKLENKAYICELNY